MCWTLARMNELEGIPQLTFKGGTSWSKVYGLIERFSEDIDLTFSRDSWDFVGERNPLGAGLSERSGRPLSAKEIGERSTKVVRDVVVPG